ncbi:polyphosphate:nucleotide phosphotransferase [Jeotgalibacillus alimentarius]|uniref:Polyphosphate:nucleotide phosphotransferase n=1 Tax=Jeotgalibacillus alimentarius TaxID=135826 RepID=A0A0C2VRU3_9BACL|nr:polyphosphate:nucleotide phosphotransferase [Jeotgalibacillus alimentarius]
MTGQLFQGRYVDKMNIKKYLVDCNKNVSLKDFATTEKDNVDEKEFLEEHLPKSIEKLKDLHWRLHAEEKKGIVVVLQAMDAAGKDEAISYIFSNLTAQGLTTASFQKPS